MGLGWSLVDATVHPDHDVFPWGWVGDIDPNFLVSIAIADQGVLHLADRLVPARQAGHGRGNDDDRLVIHRLDGRDRGGRAAPSPARMPRGGALTLASMRRTA
jgi:hypothetical protein